MSIESQHLQSLAQYGASIGFVYFSFRPEIDRNYRKIVYLILNDAPKYNDSLIPYIIKFTNVSVRIGNGIWPFILLSTLASFSILVLSTFDPKYVVLSDENRAYYFFYFAFIISLICIGPLIVLVASHGVIAMCGAIVKSRIRQSRRRNRLGP